MAFFDVQNLYRHAKQSFGDDYHHPNFDPKKLHLKVAQNFGFKTSLTRFYTGVPVQSESEMWAGYWSNRVLALKRAGVFVETRKLRYHAGGVSGVSGVRVRFSQAEKGTPTLFALFRPSEVTSVEQRTLLGKPSGGHGQFWLIQSLVALALA